MDMLELQRDAMKVKPASKRAARQKSSVTPPDVYRLCYNESPYGPSPKVVEALTQGAQKAFIYPDWFGIDMKMAAAELNGVDKNCIIPGTGSSAMICMLGEIFLNPGDEMIVGDPSYEAFRDVAYDYGATPITVPLDDNMCYDLDAMLAAITPKTKMIVVVNPNNPTGTFIESAKLEEFIKKVPENIITVVDEAYLEYVTKPETYSMTKLIAEGYGKPLIILKTLSKIYGMAGIRVGYGVMAPDTADCMCKSSHAWNVSKIGQDAAVVALKEQGYIQTISDVNSLERDRVMNALKKMGCRVYESQTNFILFKSEKKSAAEIRDFLAENKVLIGAPVECCRVSLGTPEMNDKFIALMKEILT